MIRTAATLFQRQGFAATGWRQVVAESGTPWGTQSHHFPGGKEELAVAAIDKSGADYERIVRAVFARDGPADAIRAWTELAADLLESTGWTNGCPVATVALEQAHHSDPIGKAAASAFTTWRDAIADGLVGAGIKSERAGALAVVVLASIEGALLLARAERDRGPLTAVGHEMAALVESAM
jgi:TetR/AcrR family transcriptional repressor of lmrAB and yxaGH operons